MYPIINFLGIKIGTYGLLVLIGIVSAFVAAYLCARVKYEKKGEEFITAYLFALAFAIVGSATLKPIINIITIIYNWESYKSLSLEEAVSFIFGEIVFYGGLIGGVAGLILFSRMFRINIWALLDVGAVSIPLGHAIGRIGCFFGGCCWGTGTTSENLLSIVYPPYPVKIPEGLAAPAGVPLWNVPIMEAGFLIVLFVSNLFIYNKSRLNGVCTCYYLMAYGAWRFFIEFLRGDAIRGKYLIFTTSQYISMVLILSGIIAALYIKRKSKFIIRHY